MQRRIFWIVLGAMLAAWLAMNLGTAPRIEALAGGLRLLDMRLAGYSFVEARDFIEAIGDEGVGLYLGPQLWLDTIFPPLLGAVLILVYRRLFPGLPGLIIGACTLVYVALDLLENAAIAAMLRAGSDGLTPEMAARAGMWTTTKWGMALVGLLTLVIGITLSLRRRFSAPARRPLLGPSGLPAGSNRRRRSR